MYDIHMMPSPVNNSAALVRAYFGPHWLAGWQCLLAIAGWLHFVNLAQEIHVHIYIQTSAPTLASASAVHQEPEQEPPGILDDDGEGGRKGNKQGDGKGDSKRDGKGMGDSKRKGDGKGDNPPPKKFKKDDETAARIDNASSSTDAVLAAYRQSQGGSTEEAHQASPPPVSDSHKAE